MKNEKFFVVIYKKGGKTIKINDSQISEGLLHEYNAVKAELYCQDSGGKRLLDTVYKSNN